MDGEIFESSSSPAPPVTKPEPASTQKESTSAVAVAKNSGRRKKVKKAQKVAKTIVTEDGIKKSRRGTKGYTYNSFIFKVLRAGNPTGGISSSAMSVMNSFMNEMFEKIATEAARCVKVRKGKTLMVPDIQAAVKLIIPGELGKHAVYEATNALRLLTTRPNT